jgi:DNA-binding transcriptional ArsR family regulator
VSNIPQMAEVAALVGDPARANILCALLGGRALTAKELAFAAGVSPQTASDHLRKRHAARLLVARKAGPPSLLPALASRLFQLKWIERGRDSRALIRESEHCRLSRPSAFAHRASAERAQSRLRTFALSGLFWHPHRPKREDCLLTVWYRSSR